MEYFPNVEGGDDEIPDDELNDERIESNGYDDTTPIETPPPLSMDDVFVQKPIKMKQVIEEEKPKPKKERKKRVMTEEHKRKLAEARVKALEVRRENARIKREEKELLKMKKKQDLEKLRNEVTGKPVKMKVEELVETKPIEIPKPQPQPKPQPKPVVKMYSQQDLDNAVLQGIAGYDSLRKTRKKEKDEQRKLDEHERKIKEDLMRRCSAKNIVEDNPFSHCF